MAGQNAVVPVGCCFEVMSLSFASHHNYGHTCRLRKLECGIESFHGVVALQFLSSCLVPKDFKSKKLIK